jgi:hypothetical protein
MRLYWSSFGLGGLLLWPASMERSRPLLGKLGKPLRHGTVSYSLTTLEAGCLRLTLQRLANLLVLVVPRPCACNVNHRSPVVSNLHLLLLSTAPSVAPQTQHILRRRRAFDFRSGNKLALNSHKSCASKGFISLTALSKLSPAQGTERTAPRLLCNTCRDHESNGQACSTHNAARQASYVCGEIKERSRRNG